MDRTKHRNACNEILMSLIGSEELVNTWWESPNYSFGLKTPNSLWYNDREQEVINYILKAVSR